MPNTKISISFDEWQAALDQFRQNRVDQIPSGWITPKQYAKVRGVLENRAQLVLRRLVGSGQAERKKYQVVVNEEFDMVRPVWHYRLKSPSNDKILPPKTKSKKKKLSAEALWRIKHR